jgi:8-oxo-dGTP diphosphatase
MLKVVAAVVERNGRVLIAQRRPDDRLGGQWEFPGGKVEAGETPEAALVRELREEFAIESEVLGFVGANIHAYETFTIELLAYRVRYLAGAFALHDHQAIRWVTPAELSGYPFAAADVPIVALLQAEPAPGH